MTFTLTKRLGLICAVVALAGTARGALVVNAAQPITKRVNVQVIQSATDNGSAVAPLFGTPAQQAAIFDNIDTIWKQAGIDIEFKFRTGTYNNTFAYQGNGTDTTTRPNSDLNTIFTNAAAAGLLDPDPKVLNLIMVRIVPGFAFTTNNTSNGLAFVPGNGITAWAGPGLPTFAGGQEVVGSVIAHEIGHNLGLNHIVEDFNLMQAGTTGSDGERLNATQIGTARGSMFAVDVPEPAAATVALTLFLPALAGRRRRASAA